MVNDNLWYAIYSALSLSAISSGILASQKKEFRYFALFAFLCCYILWTENYAEILIQRKKLKPWLFNLEVVIEFTFLIFIQSFICKIKLSRKSIATISIIFLMFCIYWYNFKGNLNEREYFIYSTGVIITILCCFYNLAHIMFSLNDTPLHKQPNLLHTIAIVFFHGTTFILQSSYSLLVGLPKVFLNNITTFLYIVYAGTYFIHTWAFCTQIDFHKLHPRRWFKFNSFSFTNQPFK